MIHLRYWKRTTARTGLALVALLAVPGLARAQGAVPEIKKPSPLATYEGREENETIMIDIDKSEFGDKGLPFDVAFKIEGPLPGKFGPQDRLDARFVEFNRVPDCESFFSRFRVARQQLTDLNETDFIPVRRTRRAESAIATSGFRQARIFDAVTRQTIETSMVAIGAETTTTKTEKTTEQASRFVVDFPPLKPNHYYCFQFISRKSLSKEKLLELQTAFEKEVDNELRKKKYVAPNGEEFVVTTEDYEKLRTTLGALIESKLENRDQVVLAPKGSFFDVGASLDDITAPYRRQFEDIAETTVDVRLGEIRNYDTQIKRAAGLLEKLGNTEIDNQTLKQKLSTVAEAREHLGLLDLSAKQLRERIEGVPADQAEATGLDEIWEETEESSPIKDRIRRIKALSNAVQDLIEAARAAGVSTIEERPVRRVTESGFGRQTTADPEASESQTESQPERQPGRQLDVSEIVETLDNAVASLGRLQKTLDERSQDIEEWVHDLLVEEQKSLVVGATTIAKYDTRAVWYMSVDLGSGLSWDTEDLFTYVGWNVYFRPVNKKSHLSWGGRPFGFREEFLRRFSITLGVVQTGFEEGGANDPTFRGVVGSKAAVLGAGLRVNDSLRLSVGGLVFENENPDPLINTTTLNWSPYVALSFDWNATATFAGLFAKK